MKYEVGDIIDVSNGKGVVVKILYLFGSKPLYVVNLLDKFGTVIIEFYQ